MHARIIQVTPRGTRSKFPDSTLLNTSLASTGYEEIGVADVLGFLKPGRSAPPDGDRLQRRDRLVFHIKVYC